MLSAATSSWARKKKWMSIFDLNFTIASVWWVGWFAGGYNFAIHDTLLDCSIKLTGKDYKKVAHFCVVSTSMTEIFEILAKYSSSFCNLNCVMCHCLLVRKKKLLWVLLFAEIINYTRKWVNVEMGCRLSVELLKSWADIGRNLDLFW